MTKHREIRDPMIFLTEGTGGVPSTHKSNLASRALGVMVEPVLVRGPEPSYISDPLDLVLAKWWLFHQNAMQDHAIGEEVVVEMVADVACGFRAARNQKIVDARKEKNVIGVKLDERQKDVAKKVSARFAKFGSKNIIAHIDAALVMAHTQYGDSDGSVVASGISESRVLLPGNPLRDPVLFEEYLDWANLGERQLTSVPWATDMVTAVGFLTMVDWWHKHDYVYGGIEDIVTLPASYEKTHAGDQRYINSRLDYFYSQGRLPEKILENMEPAMIVGLLSVAFNFPTPFVGTVFESMLEEKIQPGQINYLPTVFHK